MKKGLFGIGLSAMLVTTNVSADFISGDMTLRDAIYLYDQDIDARGSKLLAGYNCDVFQLVLDVTSGFTDLKMLQANQTELSASTLVYPDRIYENAAMFSYALYQNKSGKFFQFGDKTQSASAYQQIGTGTIFGYCYSTKPDAFVYFYEEDKCTVKYSDGYVDALSNCTPK